MEIVETSDLGPAVASRAQRLLSATPGQATSLALVGGRTAALYLPALFAAPLDWHRIAITLADDRLVPPDNSDSNLGVIESLRQGTAAAAARIVPLVTRYDDAIAAAEEADRRLPQALPWPLDLVVLGLGDDGHFASLFPGRPAGLVSKARCIGIAAPPAPHRHPRVSLTLAALTSAKAVLLPLAGDAKRRAFAAALDTRDSPVATLARLTGDRLCVIVSD